MRVAVVVLLVACSKPDAPPNVAPLPAPAGPKRIVFGDCASPAIDFVSGPRPARWTRKMGYEIPFTYDEDEENKLLDAQRDRTAFACDGCGPGMPSHTRNVLPGDDGRVPSRLQVHATGAPELLWAKRMIVRSPGVERGLTQRQVLTEVLAHRDALDACVDKPLPSSTKRHHTKLFFIVQSDGSVKLERAANKPAPDAEFEQCVRAVVGAAHFPRPSTGAWVSVIEVFEDRTGKPPARPVYAPGADNPLRTVEDKLRECVKTSTYGAVVVEDMRPNHDPSTPATVSSTDPSIAACVVAAVRELPRWKFDSERCAFAYGTMPTEALPAIDVDENTVAPAMKAEPSGVISIANPVVLHVHDNTSIKTVRRVASALASDYVLAYERDGSWRLATSLDLPGVPVPKTTGLRWSWPVRTTRESVDEDDLVLPGVRITAKGLAVALPSARELRTVDRATLPAALRDAWTDPRRALQPVLELSVDDDVPFRDVANVIDVARSVGFTEPMLRDPT